MAENIEIENSYYKGANFEIRFAEFMKSDLGWDKYVIRSQQKGKANSKGSQVDIIGERFDVRGKRLYNLAIVYLVLMIGFCAAGIYMDEDWLAILGVLIGIIAIFISLKSRNLHKENVWVECKNLKGKATIEQIRKSIDEYQDYVATQDKEYKFIEWYFVSASGFVENALKLAMDNGIVCFEYNKSEKFEKVTYWK